ncbi:alpha/beta hydrolase [Saccharopolyspora sp. NPDC047091]|uniref:alpha/beta fold hydrolase n=1 Tax=Saccharopolyspora sp. NPDC047091 TaxID=3155924 RepID=UPI003411A5A0
MAEEDGFVEVVGGKLYYETRGDGPPLLLIQGGLSEAGATTQLAEHLTAAGYRVITYDRRGLSRSETTSAEPPVTMRLHAADAAALLDAVATEPALVVGPSIGAVIGLHLTITRPDLVELLVAHEPPMPCLVRDPEQEAGLDAVAEIAATGDVVAAIRRFAALGGERDDEPEIGARSPKPVGDPQANLRRFFDHDFSAVRTAELSFDELAAARPRIVATGGARSQGKWEHRCAERLAELLDRPLISLPGGHNGLTSHPAGATAGLLELFAAART